MVLHDRETNIDHYNRVVRDKTRLYDQRFDRHILSDRPIVRELMANAYAQRFREEAGRMLDVGCGTGFYYPLLSRHAKRLVGIDVSDEMLQIAKATIEACGLENCEVHHGSAADIEFPDGHFDAVHSWDVLHHVESPHRVLEEIMRVLKPGGLYVGFEPNVMNPSIAWYHMRRRSEWRLFLQNQFSLPGTLKQLAKVRIEYDNAIISFLNEKTWPLWKTVDVLSSFRCMRFVAFRYVIIAVKNQYTH